MVTYASGCLLGQEALSLMDRNADRSIWIAAMVAVLWVCVLAQSSDRIGVPRDESFYLVASDFAAAWYGDLLDPNVESFSRAQIERRDRFGWNWEHPVLMKSLFGLSKRFLHDEFGIINSPLLAYRLPAMCLAGLCLLLVFLMARQLGGVLAGFLAQAACMCLPRMFFHSHLACFDLPVTVLWLAITYSFFRARYAAAWILPAGVLLGLGFATKLNVFFLPFLLLLVAISDVAVTRFAGGEAVDKLVKRYALIGSSFVLVGGVVFFAHWPLLYHDAIGQLRRYIEFHARHVHYPVDYFGVLQYRPPFAVHFPFVMTLVSVPLVTLILSFIGLWTRRAAIKRTLSEPWSAEVLLTWLVILNVIVPMLIIAVPNTPIFGGTKHWMPAMPFLAIFAGCGGAGLLSNMPSLTDRPFMKVAAAALLLSSPIWATAKYGASGPAYYSEIIGGPPGAASLGLSRNFWGYSTRSVLSFIDKDVEKSGLVFWHKATRRSIDAYKDEAWLRRDVGYTGDWTAEYSDWAVYHNQREKLPEEVDIWRAYGDRWPVSGAYLDGLELMSVYRRGPRPRPRPPESL